MLAAQESMNLSHTLSSCLHLHILQFMILINLKALLHLKGARDIHATEPPKTLSRICNVKWLIFKQQTGIKSWPFFVYFIVYNYIQISFVLNVKDSIVITIMGVILMRA